MNAAYQFDIAYGNSSADPFLTASFANLSRFAPPGAIIASPVTQGVEEIRTIFITGFPADVKDRELNNLLRFLPGYEASQMNWKTGQPQGFALFSTATHAKAAVDILSQLQFDDNNRLRCEIAHKNMFLKDDPLLKRGLVRSPLAPSSSAVAFPQAGLTSPGFIAPQFPSPAILAAATGLRHVEFAPVTNTRDNPPCNTLFIGNLGDNVDEQELRLLFSSQPGYKQLKLVRGPKLVNCFVEYADVSTAVAVHSLLQGALLPSSDRGGIRIQYSRNPFGKRGSDDGSPNPLLPL